MDIPTLSMALSQTQIITQVQTAVLAETMDVAETESDALARMMELSVNPSLGSKLDVRV